MQATARADMTGNTRPTKQHNALSLSLITLNLKRFGRCRGLIFRISHEKYLSPEHCSESRIHNGAAAANSVRVRAANSVRVRAAVYKSGRKGDSATRSSAQSLRLSHHYLQIHHVVLDKLTTPYEALSYTWGGSSLQLSISIDHGNGPRSYLDVTDNLYFALWRLRLPWKSRWLWVDRVCINQDDNIEKAAQVLMMRDIYARSRRGVIWLGEHDESSKRGMELIYWVHIASHWDRTNKLARNLFERQSGPPRLPDPTSREWWVMFSVLRREWFTRAWIVQELAVSPDPLVVCGSRQIPWTSFWEAFDYMHKIGGERLPAYSGTFLQL